MQHIHISSQMEKRNVTESAEQQRQRSPIWRTGEKAHHDWLQTGNAPRQKHSRIEGQNGGEHALTLGQTVPHAVDL